MKKTILIVVGVLLLLGVIGALTDDREHEPLPRNSETVGQAKPAKPVPTVAQRVGHDSSKAAERKAFIQKLVNEDVVDSVTMGAKTVRVVVPPTWANGKFADKQQLATVFLSWGLDHDPNCDLVRFSDARSNKAVATYSVDTGYVE